VTSLFDIPVSELLTDFGAIAPAVTAERSLRAAYALEPLPWIGRRLGAATAELSLRMPAVASRTEAPDGTTKFLVTLADARAVECVLIPGVRGTWSREQMSARNRDDGAARRRRPTSAACVSTQVGCGAGCSFCASGLGGLTRNLTAGEIVAQALLLRREAAARGLRLSTVVFMGMGEPLHNVENVMTAIHNLTHRHAGALPRAGITVSTVGILTGMKTLAESPAPPHLAVSLHAPDDDTRAKIVRTAPRLWNVEETLDAAVEYSTTTKQNVTISYVLLDGINDSPAQAELLARRIGGRRLHVNLIPHNIVDGLPFGAATPANAHRFWTILRQQGTLVHLRKARGAGEDAACGQLRSRATPPPPA
jgi:23S rRNA (adenine2503-C2)-methyltransferase